MMISKMKLSLMIIIVVSLFFPLAADAFSPKKPIWVEPLDKTRIIKQKQPSFRFKVKTNNDGGRARINDIHFQIAANPDFTQSVYNVISSKGNERFFYPLGKEGSPGGGIIRYNSIQKLLPGRWYARVRAKDNYAPPNIEMGKREWSAWSDILKIKIVVPKKPQDPKTESLLRRLRDWILKLLG